MYGLIVLAIMAAYLLLSIAVVKGARAYARNAGRSVAHWGWGAALMMGLIPFCIFLRPTIELPDEKNTDIASMITLAEYAKTGRCYREGSLLSAEELRARAIRSLLSAWMETSAHLNKDKFRYHSFLIRNSLTPNDVITSIASKSIVNFPQQAAYPLQTDSDVAVVNADFLRGEFSIVRYSAIRYAEIIPSKSLEAVEARSAHKFFEKLDAHGVGLSLPERAQGFGNHVFRFDLYGFIDVACCEERFSKSFKYDKPPEWYTQYNIDSILSGEQPSHYNLVVSNCGEILQRQEEDGMRYYYPK